MNFTRQELHVLRHAVEVAYEEPRTELLEKIAAAIATFEPGALVFQLEFALWSAVALARRRRRSGLEAPPPPRLWAPTLNEYKGIKSYELAKLRTAVDEAILRARVKFPHWGCGVVETMQLVRGKPVRHRSGGRRRLVLVERESNRPPDELSTDAIGGKVPIDRLVAAGVLRDDNRDWLLRDARWRQASRGEGRVIVSVFELEDAGGA